MSLPARLGEAQEWSVEFVCSIAGAAFQMTYKDLGEIDARAMLPPSVPAATDGTYVFTTPALEKYTRKEKVFIFLHEMMHAILQHGPRAAILHKNSIHQFHPEIFNIAADAIINHSLNTGLTDEGKPHKDIDMPRDVVTFSGLMVKLGHANNERAENINPLLSKYSTESLYFELFAKHLEKCKNNQKQQSSQTRSDNSEKGSGEVSGGQDGRVDKPDTDGENHSKDCPCYGAKHFGDVIEHHGDSEKSSEEHMQAWQHNARQLAGLNPGFFDRLAGEFPKIETPWQTILRNFLHRMLGPKILTNYARPSRRYSGLEAGYFAENGVDLPFEPAKDRPKETARIGIVLDTSGSIGEEILNRFLAEVATVIEMTDSQICLITCDAKVHEIREIEEGADAATLRKLTYKGGGGTQFEPGIEAAVEAKVDAIVYLTDLYGSFGEDPGIPVMWAVPLSENPAPHQPPFGTLITLK